MTAIVPSFAASGQRWLVPLLAILVQTLVNCGGNTARDLRREPDASMGGTPPSAAGGAADGYPDYWQCFEEKDCPAGEYCGLGRCRHVEDCEPSKVTCEAERPECPPGSAPRVDAGCWGDCVPVQSCADLKSCQLCYERDMLCAVQSFSGRHYTCASKQPGCGATSCACGGQRACGITHCSAVDGDMLSCFWPGFLPGQCCDVLFSPLCDEYRIPNPPEGCP